MKILIIVGMAGSGKTVCSNLAKRMNIFTLTSGDIIRDEIKKRGLQYNEQNDLKIARWFNKKDREKLLAKRLAEKIKEHGNPKRIVIEGLRSPDGVNELKRLLKERDRLKALLNRLKSQKEKLISEGMSEERYNKMYNQAIEKLKTIEELILLEEESK